MAIASYSDLQTAVADYLHRSDLTSAIQTWIGVAEDEFEETLYFLRLLNPPTAFSATASFTDLPADFRRMRSVALIANNRRYPMRNVSMDAFNTFVYNVTPGGLPHSFVITGGQIGIAPGTSADLEIEYWPTFSALSGSVSTNDVLDNYPRLYLYRTLMEGAIYLRYAELYTQMQQQFAQAFDQATQSDTRERFGVAPVIAVV